MIVTMHGRRQPADRNGILVSATNAYFHATFTWVSNFRIVFGAVLIPSRKAIGRGSPK